MPSALSTRAGSPAVPASMTVADLIVIEENERGAFASRLHDGPVQDLLATRYLTDLALTAAAKGADAEALRARLESIREAAVLALAGGRRMMSELTARGVTGVGLTGALRSSAATISPGATVLTGDATDPELGELPPAIAVTAYRLAGAMLRVCAGTTPHLSVRREGHTLTLILDAPVDLDHPDVDGCVIRARSLGADVESGTTTRATFLVLAERIDATAPAPEGQS